MKTSIHLILTIALSCATLLFANPYFDETKVPKDLIKHFPPQELKRIDLTGEAILRVDLSWQEQGDSFKFERAKVEHSGTPSLFKRAKKKDLLGSYLGILREPNTHKEIFFDSVGTGQEFRLLVRALTFRFPLPPQQVEFVLYAENPQSGQKEIALVVPISPAQWELLERSQQNLAQQNPNIDVRQLKKADKSPALYINIYAEGYLESKKEQFWQKAQKVVDALKTSLFPSFEHMELNAIFGASKTELGDAKNLGLPVNERDSFLGLYYPYWDPFGRWYHVVYPTREAKYRDAIGAVAYDYPIIIIDSAQYWGVGNFNELTAVPSSNMSFTYLLLHEFGHFFGLNEEYEGGGKTELAFAPGIDEPWSQNITFLSESILKWSSFTLPATPIPTPSSLWSGNGPYGAYQGGYADTEPLHKSHKPGFGCVMSSGSRFCPICQHAIKEKINFDLGGATVSTSE